MNNPRGVHIPKGRITELDGLRGLAILLVLGTHFWPDRGILGFFHPVATAGWMGVDLFFCLSGFLITGILLDNLGKPNYYVNFYGRRTIRIFPLYYTLLLIFTANSLLFKGGAPYREIRDTWGSILWFFFYAANFRCSWMGRWPPNDSLTVMWSLQIEEQFYLTYPWAVAKIGKQHLLKFLVGIIGLGLVVRLATYAAGMNPFVQYTLTFCRVDSLAMGGLVAVCLRTYRWPWSPTATGRLALAVAAVVIVGQVLGGPGWKADFNRTVGFTIICAAFALLLAWTMFHLGDRCTSPLHFRPLTLSGTDILRVVYAPHARRAGCPDAAAAPGPAIASDELRMLATVAAAVGAATVSWYAFESPILRLKAYFQTREVTKT